MTKKQIYRNKNIDKIKDFKERLIISLRTLQKRQRGKLPLKRGTWDGLIYYDRLPSVPVIIELDNQGINLEYLFLNKGEPLKSQYTMEQEVELRDKYKELLFLVENANKYKLFPGFYKMIKAKTLLEKFERGIGITTGWPLTLMFQVIKSATGIEAYIFFYARLLEDTLKALTFDGRLSKRMVAGFHYIGGLSMTSLNENRSIIMPAIMNQKEVAESIPLFYRQIEKEIAKKSSTSNLLYQGIIEAFQQLSQLLIDQNLPDYCWGHNKFYWHDCSECENNREANFSLRTDIYEPEKADDVAPDITEQTLYNQFVYIFEQVKNRNFTKQQINALIEKAHNKVNSDLHNT